MRLRSKVLLSIPVLLVVGSLVVAHVVATKFAAPTYISRCNTAKQSNVLVLTEFGTDAGPLVRRACVKGVDLQATASIDDSGDLLIESTDSRLAVFDGRRSPDDVMVRAQGIDHSYDTLKFRALEAATPFVDLDQTMPYEGGEESFTMVEVGRPRVERSASGGTRLRMDAGPITDDRSIVLYIGARQSTSDSPSR